MGSPRRVLKRKMNLDYIAGFFDGEGCITLGLSRVRYYDSKFGWKFLTRISITQKDRAILDRIQRQIGGLVCRNGSSHVLQLRTYHDLWNFVHTLKDYLIIKQAELYLFEKALHLLDHPGRSLSKSEFLTVLDIAKKLRKRPGKYDIDKVRTEIELFDEEAYLLWLNESYQKRATRRRRQIPENELRELYIAKHWILRDIANRFGCCITTIRNRMKEYGILARPRGTFRLERKRNS